jgi:hypothetical protein
MAKAKEKQVNENRLMIDEYFHNSDEEGPVVFDGLDEAIIGVAQQFTNDQFVAYSMTKILDILQEQGMSHEEALEYFSFNIQGLWAGEGTPFIIDDYHFCR